MPMTTTFAQTIANAAVGNVSFTPAANTYAALYTDVLTAAGSGTELTGNGYSRVEMAYSIANGVASSTANVSFTCSGNNWPTVRSLAILDGSGAGKTITAYNQAQVSTAQSKFGGASAVFDGTGDYLATSSSADFVFDSNFTIEFWARLSSTGSIRVPITNRNTSTGTGRWWFELGSDNTAYAGFQNTAGTSYYPNMPGSFSANTWTHIAIVRDGSSLKIYKDGTGGTEATVTGTFGVNAPIFIGGLVTSYGWDGYIDEVRISNTARYTSNFTPSSTAFTHDDNTVLLLHCDGTNGSTTFTDDVGSNNMLFYQPIAARNVKVGDTLTFEAGDIQIIIT